MGKHEAPSVRQAAPQRGKQKKHIGIWITLVVLIAVVGYLLWFLLTPPDSGSFVTPPDEPDAQQEDPDLIPATPINPIDPQTNAPEIPEIDPEKPVKREMKQGWYTILLAGTLDQYNTDTMMLCSVDSVSGKVKLVSINRDTQIDVNIRNKKINATYGRKGPEAMCQAVTEITGVPINYYVVVNMDSFRMIIDLIGGVEYDVPFQMYHRDSEEIFDIKLEEGRQTLNGLEALQFVRFRSTKENDFGRVNRQKDFLLAAAKQAMQKFSITQIQDYIKIFNENVETNMSVQDMVWFYLNVVSKIDLAEDVTSDTLPYESTGNYDKVAYVYLDPQTIVDYVNENLNPYTTDLTTKDVNIPHFKD